MGKLEKVIVLSVLAVIAVILVLSLTLDDPLKKEKAVMAGSSSTKTAAANPSAPLAGEPKDKAIAPPTSSPALGLQSGAQPPLNAPSSTATPAVAALPPSGAGANGAAPSTLLSANIAAPKSETPVVATPPALPAGSILKSTDGLQDSYVADMKFYTWQSGDSFRSIAAKVYGDAAKFTVLRRSNEGRENVQPGEKILVPVFDLDAPHGEVAATATLAAAPAPSQPAAQGSAPSKSAQTANLVAPKTATAPSAGPRVHVVKDGESLWKIAKIELGDGGRWNEIFEANRDMLSKPEAVHAGMKLRVPAK
jgi:nucleoid-associated protein YgaU